jgi:RsiW-degrading membrane proteinase PrsW (M82 family)
MSPLEYLQQYLILLRIRRSAARRAVVITGAVFFISVVTGLVWNLVVEPNGRSLFLSIVLIMGLSLGFASAWSRLDALQEIVGLADELCAAHESDFLLWKKEEKA